MKVEKKKSLETCMVEVKYQIGMTVFSVLFRNLHPFNFRGCLYVLGGLVDGLNQSCPLV